MQHWVSLNQSSGIKANSLHHKNSIALHPISKHVISRPKYFGSTEENYQHAPSTANEVILNIKKELVQSEILENISQSSFLVWNPRAWKIHPHSFTNTYKKYTILAESEDSPQIIQLNSAVGCLFTFENKYPETWQVLENFLRFALKVI